MSDLNLLKTLPEKLRIPLTDDLSKNLYVNNESFFKKFKTFFKKDIGHPVDAVTTENKSDFKHDFSFDDNQQKNNSFYWIFGGVFFIFLGFSILILYYLYQPNKFIPKETSLEDTTPKTHSNKNTVFEYKSKNLNTHITDTGFDTIKKNIDSVNNAISNQDYQTALDETQAISHALKSQPDGIDKTFIPLRIENYNNLSEIYYRLNDPQKAVSYSKKALKDTLNLYGHHHIITAKQYEIIAFHFDNIGDFDTALQFRHDAIMIRLSSNDKEIDQGQLITDMNNLGEEYRTLGHFNKSKKILQQAINRTERQHGIDAPELIVILNNLGLTHKENNEITIGLAFLQQAYQLAFRHYGRDHELTRIITKNIARIRDVKS